MTEVTITITLWDVLSFLVTFYAAWGLVFGALSAYMVWDDDDPVAFKVGFVLFMLVAGPAVYACVWLWGRFA